jgi:hypothetical protein
MLQRWKKAFIDWGDRVFDVHYVRPELRVPFALDKPDTPEVTKFRADVRTAVRALADHSQEEVYVTTPSRDTESMEKVVTQELHAERPTSRWDQTVYQSGLCIAFTEYPEKQKQAAPRVIYATLFDQYKYTSVQDKVRFRQVAARDAYCE